MKSYTLLLVCLAVLILPVGAQSQKEIFEKFDRLQLERDFPGPEAPKPGLGESRSDFVEQLKEFKKSGMADIGNAPEWNWVRAFTGQGGADIRDIAVVGSTVYAYGTFSDSMTIGNTTLVSTGLRDVFVARIGSFGTLTWLRTLSALPDENIMASHIAVGPDGVVITGGLETSQISGGGKSAAQTAGENMFLAHIASDGTIDWIKVYNDLETLKLRVAGNNSIYRLTSWNLQKYDQNGDQTWVSSGDGLIKDISVEDTNVWVVGAIADTGMQVGNSVFTWDWQMGATYYARLNSNNEFSEVEFMPHYVGNPEWTRIYMHTDPDGSLYILGPAGDTYFRDSVIQTWPANNYILKLDPSRNLEWLKYRDLGENMDFQEFHESGDGKFYIKGYSYGDTIRAGNLFEPTGENYLEFILEMDRFGNYTQIILPDEPLYVYEYGPSNTFYTVSYKNYDHWIHKKTISGAESWKLYVWNNGGDAAAHFTMDIDEDGNLYAQGYYRGTVNFFGQYIKGRGIFFMKFRNNGTVEWFKTMENATGFSYGIKVDKAGNVYAWGSFVDFVRMEGLELTSKYPDARDIYLVKLDLDGQLKYIKQFSGTGLVYGWGGLALTPENDILISGSFSDTLYLGPYTLKTDQEGDWDLFVTKVSSSGNVKWARSYGGAGRDWGRTIATDEKGNVYLSGGYRDSIGFDSTSFIHRGGAYDLYLTKLDPNGDVIWARNGGEDNYWLRGHSITTDGDQVYVMGVAWIALGWMETITFGDQQFISEFQYNNFLASYTKDGELNWVKIFKINNWSWPVYKIDTDAAGNIYAGGVFQDTIVVESNLLQGSGAEDFYILKYAPDGNFKWMKTSESSSRGELDLYSLAVFEEDVVLVGGTLINGYVEIAGQEIRTASQASYAGLLGKDIIGCVIELSVETEDEEFGKGDGSATVSIAGGTAPYYYEWSTGDTAVTSVDSLLAGTYQVSVLDDKGCEQFEVFAINVKNGPRITLNELGNASCHGFADGFIDISVTGGTEPYTYFWDNGYATQDLTNLQAAPYSVTVTDANGLVVSADYLIEEPKPLNISYSIVQASCGGGTDGEINVFTSGGTKPYDWEWNTSVLTESLVGEKAGKYTLKVLDANNCLQETEIALSEKDAPVVETEFIEAASCNQSDGSAKVRVANASGTISYLWNDGTPGPEITGKRAREYFVEVENDAGCKSIHLVNLPEKKPIDNQICLVTVDTVIGSNLIVWEKVKDALQYHIYRETTKKDVYLLAGTTLGEDLSVFVDSVANPLIRSYRYKIAALDECGNESFLSHLHKTVHMTISRGLSDNIMNLRWDDYAGEEFESFEVWRYTSLFSWELLATLPSNLRSYSDFSVPPGVVFYNVRVPFEESCKPTGNLNNKAGTGPYTHSLSNLDDNKLKEDEDTTSTGFKSYMADQFYVYPNPTDGIVNVWSESFNIVDGEILVSDLAGRIVIHREFERNLSGRLQLDLSTQPAGAYLVQLRLDGKIFYQKLVKR